MISARFFLADVRSPDVIARHMRDIDVVFHAAALKHVLLCERAPVELISQYPWRPEHHPSGGVSLG